jgi:hypothetical protein
VQNDLRTTFELNTVILNKNLSVLEIKEILKEQGVFCKIFPSPKSVLKACAPIVCISNKDTKKAQEVLDNNGVEYTIVELENDIIWELLKK